VIQAHGGNKTCWNYVVEHLTADDAVLVIDETGFLKQGRTSCGALLGVNANHWFGAWNTTPLIAGEAKDIAQELPAEAWQRLDASSDSSPSMVDSFGPQSPRQSLEDLGRWGAISSASRNIRGSGGGHAWRDRVPVPPGSRQAVPARSAAWSGTRWPRISSPEQTRECRYDR